MILRHRLRPIVAIPGFIMAVSMVGPGSFSQSVTNRVDIDTLRRELDAALADDRFVRQAEADAAGILGENDPADPILFGGATEEGSPVLMVDVFNAMGNERVKEASWVFKLPVALLEGTKQVPKDIATHPWQWVVGGLGAWELINGGPSSIFNDLVGSSDEDDISAAKSDLNVIGDGNKVVDAQQGQSVTIKGENNTIDYQQRSTAP